MKRIRKIRVFGLAVPIALLAVAGTALADPLIAEAVGLDFWQVGRLERDLRRSNAKNDRLENELQAIVDRTHIHSLIQDDLAAGRISLPEAAKQKWAMNAHREEMKDFLNRHRSGRTFEAKMAHDLYLRVALLATDNPLPESHRARLRFEYQAAYGETMPGKISR